ncbi:MAG: YggS family pyridoxal phosphate-dependent enzyme [Bacteroidia bacterium]|nr:YggS family pyridoxal phosphate-dependent enzyme [Bacteroidia bacterium]NNM15730.1 YggS family pyridoxal phosphate-dependent enzyme [Bacteroidia bacterium]
MDELFNEEKLDKLLRELSHYDATLVAVSKKHTVESIQAVYDHGHKIFGENRVQELVQKQPELPKDIEWHQVGHLQTNKVKLVLPIATLTHSVDSERLLAAMNKEAGALGKVADCLLQIRIAREETKYGFIKNTLKALIEKGKLDDYPNLNIRGYMGIATQTEDASQIRKEYKTLNKFFEESQEDYKDKFPNFDILSMGMTDDHQIALDEGSTMIRVGSAIFGPRD